jgi:hypothetical protein
MCHIILSSVARWALPYSSTISHKRNNFWGWRKEKEVIEHEMCVLISNTVFETFFILRRIQQDIIINVNMSSCKEPVTLVRFSSNLNFLDN